MSIPSSQLETWKNSGADDSATTTYNRVKNVIEADDSIPNQKSKDFQVYLQGSYKNSTNIYANSDVDIVVQLDSTWRRNLARLSSTQRSKYKDAYSSASYTWEDFHQDIIDTLGSHYGASVVAVEDLALVLDSDSLPLTADIVVCQLYRRYKRFSSKSNQEYDEGIVFWDQSTDEKIIGYPKIHYENGTDKNGNVHGRFRETIRIFKNAKSYLNENSDFSDDTAPSYFIECLLYNVPAKNYKSDLQDRYVQILNWLINADVSDFNCQNEIQDMFGSESTQWTEDDAEEYIRYMTDLWRNWYDY